MLQWLLIKLGLVTCLSLGLLALQWQFPLFYVADWQTAVQIAVCLLLVETLVQPIIQLFITSINWLTLGLLGLIIRFLLTGIAIVLAFQALPTVGFKAPPHWLILLQVVGLYAFWVSVCLTVFPQRKK
jgi:uncharacterized membrane protein YvlD (DUF360 family)